MEQAIDRVWVADVVLPLAVAGRYTYRMPPELDGQDLTGYRVLVQFGRRQQYAAVVVGCRYLYSLADARSMKPVLEVMDERPVLQPWQPDFLAWVARYYVCTEGEVLRAALPTGLKADSHLLLVPTPTSDPTDADLSEKAYLLLEALLVEQSLTEEQAADILQLKDASRYIKELEAARHLALVPELQVRYTQKKLRCLQIAPEYSNETLLNEAFEKLKKAPRQEAILLVLAEAMLKGTLPAQAMVLQQTGATTAALNPLIKKGIVQQVDLPISRLKDIRHSPYTPPTQPTPDQQAVIDGLLNHWQQPQPGPALLHGATGSGKTFVYTRLAEHIVAQGRQVLLLLPEIALTKQVVERLRAAFGELLGVYHSRYSDKERVEIWNRVHSGEYRVVVGVRSALWLPFASLGLIIVDEEHDTSLKQTDQAPRYHARDASLYLARQLQIPILLGSGTPSLESYYQAQQGKYLLTTLPRPISPAPPPKLHIINMRDEVARHSSHGRLSSAAQAALHQNLLRQEQSIVFVSRRGYAPYLVCTSCGVVPQCPNCDISLTYHKQTSDLRCHYCGHTNPQIRTCGNCGQPDLHQQDYGTERVAEQLAELYPGARIARMDADTTRGKNGFQELLDRFENRDIDILVGTQMLTKGLDFPHLTLAIVLNADAVLSQPDFRAEERAWQLLRQFAGRTGRHTKAGQVLIQTYRPDHPLLALLAQPYETFFARELTDRRQFAYPPFSRLLQLELQHKDRAYLEQETARLGSSLRVAFGPRLAGPATPAIERIRNHYRRHYLLRLPRSAEGESMKLELQKLLADYYESAPNKTLRVVIDVDVL